MATTCENELVFGTVETRSYFKVQPLNGKAFYKVVPKNAKPCKCIHRTIKNGIERFYIIDGSDLYNVNNFDNPNSKEVVIRRISDDGRVSYTPIKDTNIEDGFAFESETKTGKKVFVIGKSRLIKAKLVIGDNDKILAVVRDED